MSRGRSMSRGGGSRGFSSGSRSSSSFRSSGSSYRGSRSSVGFHWVFPMSVSSSGKSYSFGKSQIAEESNVKYKAVRNKKATIAVCSVLAVFLIMLIYCAYITGYGTVMGKAVSYDEYYSFGETYYYTSYEYTVDGKEYSAESQLGWTNLYPMGYEYELYYSRSNPYEIYEVEGKSDLPNGQYGFVFFAIVVGVVLIVIAITGVKKYVVDEAATQAYQKEQEMKLPEGKTRCKYCGSVSEETESKCPSCGAPLSK